jgi:cytochrome P450/NADPH-cytochrome P450 reductase
LITALAAQSFNLKFRDENYELEIDNIVTLRPKNFFMHAVSRPHLDALGIAQNMNGRESSHGRGEVVSEKATTEKVAESTLHPLTILYGSNMGTCETLASYCANAAVRNGFKPSIMTLDSAVGKLPVDQPVVIIMASYEGQPADNAADFVSWVQSLREDSLSGVKFVLYGCGNRDWVSTFHRIPKLVDGALGNAGAQRLTQLCLADVSSGSISSKFVEWQDSKLWPCLRESFGLQSTKASIGGNDLGLELIATPPPQYTQQHDQQFFDCTVLENSVLTAPGHKEKRHIRLKLPSEITYSIGDYVNIYPANPLATVTRAMNRFGISLNTHMRVTSGISTIFPIGKEFSVYESLSKCVELNHPATAEVRKFLTFFPLFSF